MRDKVEPHIEVIENFFDDELIQRVRNYCCDLLSSDEPSWYTNFSTTWRGEKFNPDRPNERYDSPILINNIEKTNPNLFKAICDSVDGRFENERVASALFHVWTKDARIEWHNDTSRKDDGNRVSACTVYLNMQWLYEYGGDFLYCLGDNPRKDTVERITPRYNQGVYIRNLLHRTLPVVGSRARMCLQIWLTRDE